jgi:hypothetical protein
MTSTKSSKKDAKKSKAKKKNFSSFLTKDAYKQLNIENLYPWEYPAVSMAVSAFFKERMARLHRSFDLTSCGDAKKLLIDAICEEAIEGFGELKIWKGAMLETPTTIGVTDYLVAENLGYIEKPYLCIVEAKKDNFEQGLAQCLVQMQACQWESSQVDGFSKTSGTEILGIVSNGTTWQFYKLTQQGEVYETPAYSIGDLELLLGRLRHIFQLCSQNLLRGDKMIRGFRITEADAQRLAQLETEAGGTISAGPDLGSRLGDVIRLELFGLDRSKIVELPAGEFIEEVADDVTFPSVEL